MKVRLIIECDGRDLGRFMEIMPQKATFHATRLNDPPKLGPTGRQVADEVESHQKKASKTRPPRVTGKRMKDVILEILAEGPKKPAEIAKILTNAGFKKDSTSGRLWEMTNKERSIFKERGMYHSAIASPPDHKMITGA